MKSRIFFLVNLFFLISVMQIDSCPTCIGKFDKNMPAFFEDEYEEYMANYEIDTKTQESLALRNSHEENTR